MLARLLRIAITLVILTALMPAAPLARAADPGALVPLHTQQAAPNPVNGVAVLGGQVYALRANTLWRLAAGAAPVRVFDFGAANSATLSVLNGRLLIQQSLLPASGPNVVKFWRSDGTAAGTIALPQIVFPAGQNSVAPQTLDHNGLRYLVVSDGIWRSDGTPAGTFRVGGGSWSAGTQIVAFGARVLLSDAELWASDGSVAGTRLLAARRPQSTPLVLNNQALFSADDGRFGAELWRTDGTPAGTGILRDIQPGKGASEPRYLTLAGGRVYFTADNGRSGREVWRTDGTPAGTQLVLEACAGTCGLDTFYRPTVAQLGARTLLFTLVDGQNSLWDLSGPQPARVATLPATFSSYVGAANGALLYTITDGRTGYQLWRTDGTAAGTQRLTTLLNDPRLLSATPTLALLSGFNGVLLRSDGTPAGTQQVGAFSQISAAQIRANGFDIIGTDQTGLSGLWRGPLTGALTVARSFNTAVPAGRIWNADPLVFETPEGLWRSDGTTAGTAQLDQSVDDTRQTVGTPLPLGSRALYADTDAASGSELWSTDGTAAGTALLADLCPGVCSSAPGSLTALGNGKALFLANDGVHGREPWVTDGSAAGTQRVADINAGAASGVLDDAVVVSGGVAFFGAADASGGRQLWRSDGTAGGTRRLSQIGAGVNPASSAPQQLTAAGGSVYFTVTTSTPGLPSRTALYVTDGTATAVQIASSAQIDNLSAVGSLLIFAQVGADGFQSIWTSAGNAASTVPLTLPATQPLSYSRAEIAAAAGRAYIAKDSWLYVSDGTAGGTRALLSGTPRALRAVPGGAFFLNDNQLWQTDGTPGGTRLVINTPPVTKQLLPPACGRICIPQTAFDLRVIGDLLVYVAFTGETDQLYVAQIGSAQAQALAPLGAPATLQSGPTILGGVLIDSALLLALRVGPQGPGLYAVARRPAVPAIAAQTAPVAPGGTAAVRFTVANDGLTAGAARLAVTLPAGVTFVDSPLGPPSVSGSTYTWELPAVPVGGQAIVLRLAVPDAPLGTRYPLAVSVTPATGAASTAEVTVFVARRTVLPMVMR